MAYATPVNFDSIEGALEYLKTELQSKVDAHNKMEMNAEEDKARAELLAKQEADLRSKCTELSQSITSLEQKRETIRQEVREHSKKTTDRLDKERADFEAVRIKRREELVAKESELNDRADQLDKREITLKEREGVLDDRQTALQEASELISAQQNSFTNQQVAIDKAKSEHEAKMAQDKADLQKTNDELVEKAQFIEAQVAGLEKKRADFKNDNDEIDKARKRAQELVLMAQERMNKIERGELALKERENRLNLRGNSLKELDKALTAKRIQLEDRQATIKSYS